MQSDNNLMSKEMSQVILNQTITQIEKWLADKTYDKEAIFQFCIMPENKYLEKAAALGNFQFVNQVIIVSDQYNAHNTTVLVNAIKSLNPQEGLSEQFKELLKTIFPSLDQNNKTLVFSSSFYKFINFKHELVTLLINEYNYNRLIEAEKDASESVLWIVMDGNSASNDLIINLILPKARIQKTYDNLRCLKYLTRAVELKYDFMTRYLLEAYQKEFSFTEAQMKEYLNQKLSNDVVFWDNVGSTILIMLAKRSSSELFDQYREHLNHYTYDRYGNTALHYTTVLACSDFDNIALVGKKRLELLQEVQFIVNRGESRIVFERKGGIRIQLSHDASDCTPLEISLACKKYEVANLLIRPPERYITYCDHRAALTSIVGFIKDNPLTKELVALVNKVTSNYVQDMINNVKDSPIIDKGHFLESPVKYLFELSPKIQESGFATKIDIDNIRALYNKLFPSEKSL